MKFFLEALGRITTQWQHSHRWFCHDKPARIKAGAGPDGLFDHERSEADKERLGLKKPDKPKSSCSGS